MEAWSKMSILFLLVLSICAYSWTLPARLPAQERAARNSEPVVQRKRRQELPIGGLTAPVTPDAALANATGPKLIKDIFINMTNSTADVNSQANVIRSLHYSPKVPKCGEFNFTLTAVNFDEFILKAELYLWLNVQSPPEQDTYFVGIKTVDSNGLESTRHLRFLKLGSSLQDHYAKFHVTELLQELLRNDAKSAVFKVSIFKNYVDYEANENSYGCGAEIKFAYEDFTDETIPSLIAETRDPRIDQIDFQAIADKYEFSTNSPPINIVDARRKRETGDPPCGVQPLTVSTTSFLFEVMVEESLGTDDFEIVFPVTEDIGTCGGKCDFSIPFGSPSNHAPLLDLLLKEGTVDDSGYTQCCVPVKYRSLTLFVSSPNTAIVTLDSMIVDTCECLDVLAPL